MSTRPPAPRPGLTRFARRGSARLAYEPAGADPAAPAVVLLHDLLADRAALAGLRDVLAGEGYRLVLPDARGHGASAAFANRRVSLPDLAADVLAVLDDAGIESAHLIGHGLGGAVACELGRRASAHARSLTLIEPALPAILDDDPDPAAAAARAEARAADRSAAEAAYLGRPAGP